MKIKVCGLRQPDNILDIQHCDPNYMGFIFYDKSSRYVNSAEVATVAKEFVQSSKVGVFVNATLDTIRQSTIEYGLDFIQLHGNESVESVEALYLRDYKIIKAFQIDADFDWTVVNEYSPFVNYFLFDNASKNYGGSGKKFNWELLDKYEGDKPFFLSGGISIQDIEDIQMLNLPLLYAIDVNSGFETEPGIKDTLLVQKLIKKIRDGK